ncbi:ArsR/SmtB family transcription factor [Halorubrum sp. N11]|uniref:ArsR/SmtB family transcription factor n=1 Tax=Halorubrum sp. N11 TaxID=3402276 RepID=UPI003EB8ADBF
MASAFPLQPPVDHTPRDRTEIVIGDDEPSRVLQTLSSDTAQKLLDVLSERPRTASEVADAVGTSIQNAQYHLTRLAEAGLIEAVDTWYSSKGREMTVYALVAEEFVIQFSANCHRSS